MFLTQNGLRLAHLSGEDGMDVLCLSAHLGNAILCLFLSYLVSDGTWNAGFVDGVEDGGKCLGRNDAAGDANDADELKYNDNTLEESQN